MINYKPYGTSHSPFMGVLIYGIEEGYRIDIPSICVSLRRRQRGYGRSNRQTIEENAVKVLGGINDGITNGEVIRLQISNGDSNYRKPPITAVRSGHADYAGCVKYHLNNARPIAELASGRNTLPHVLSGSVAKQILAIKGINIVGFTREIGGIKADITNLEQVIPLLQQDDSPYAPLNCPDLTAQKAMITLIDQARARGDTLGGVAQVMAYGLPAGLGEIYNYSARLDARIAAALMAIPSVRGIEIGLGFDGVSLTGSQCADVLQVKEGAISYATNNCGGICGGLTVGTPLVIRLAVKPVPTVSGASSIDLISKQPVCAHTERSDVCVVGNVAVVAEHILAFLLLKLLKEEGL